MSEKPWFKFYAADFLIDAKIDALPPEAEGIVVRMWAICHIEGSCPSIPEELARKIRRPLAYVLKYKSYYESLFELKDGLFVSSRMEKERRRSETNRSNVAKRYKAKTSTIRSTNGNTNGRDFVVPPSDYDSDSGFVVDSKQSIDGQICEIAALYPKITDPFNLPRDTAECVASAIMRDGRDLVWVGTKAVSEAVAKWPVSDRQFLPAPQKFFRESQYLKDPAEWERGQNGKSANRAETVLQQQLDARTMARRAVGLDH